MTVQNSLNSSSQVSRCNTNEWSTVDVYTATRFAYVKYWTLSNRLIREPYFSLSFEAVVRLGKCIARHDVLITFVVDSKHKLL